MQRSRAQVVNSFRFEMAAKKSDVFECLKPEKAKSRKVEKNGLCQNCTFGALQAWSLHFLWQVLLKTETQAINAQKQAF